MISLQKNPGRGGINFNFNFLPDIKTSCIRLHPEITREQLTAI